MALGARHLGDAVGHPHVVAEVLIVNPKSFRASRGLAQQATALARAQGVEVVLIDRPAALRSAMALIVARRQPRVIVLGGDGTLGAIVDQLAHLPPPAWAPALWVLPGGRSNLTAADLTPNEPALAHLRRVLQRPAERRWDAATLTERCALRIEQSPAPARHGFFVAAAVLDDIIRRTHQHRAQGSGPFHTGAPSTVWSLLKLAVPAAFGRSDLACPPLRIDAGGLGRSEGPVRLLMVTTLQHSTGRFNPYAARGAGELRVTAVARRAPRFWRALPRLLTGRYAGSMTLDAGYLSGRCERLEMTGLSGFSLDGETFDTDPSRPVIVTPGPVLRFLVP